MAPEGTLWVLASWSTLGPSWHPLWAFKGPSGGPLGALWGPSWIPDFSSLLAAPLEPSGADLVLRTSILGPVFGVVLDVQILLWPEAAGKSANRGP